MKKSLFFIIPLLSFCICSAQTKSSGEVIYEMKFGSNTRKFKLEFNAGKAKYSSVEGDDKQKNYYFSATNKYLSGSLISNEYEVQEMQLGEGVTDVKKHKATKEVAGLKCKKATLKNIRGHEYTIWYSTEIPVKASPFPGIWTEGIVMAIESAALNVYAQALNFKVVKNTDIALPANSKFVAQDDPTKTKVIRQ